MELEYSLRYKIAVDLIKKGYLIHCTNEEFNSFDSSYIKGGFRAKEGYGFYFSDMPYKPIEYGNIWKIVKKDDFDFLDSSTPITIKAFNNDFKTEITKLEYKLENVRNAHEYDMIENQIKELKQTYSNIGGDELFNNIEMTFKQHNVSTIGSLEYNINNPKKMLPLLSKLYIYWGYDGYYTDGVYTIFNFDKLNQLVKTVDLSQYINNKNMNESFDLNSFKPKSKLNPNFWKNDKLDSRIRLKLLDIADDFTDFLKVDWVKPEDIIITGSIANYNWSKKYSDIDLHVIIDFSKVDKRTDFVKNYFDAKKNLWNQEHKGIKLYGFNVELYVQDKNEKHTSTGIYSLEKNEWITKPESKIDINNTTLKNAKKDAEKWSNKISSILNRYNSDSTDSQKEKIISDVDKIIDNIKQNRSKGFTSGGDEMNSNNITFKMLRRNGDIDKLYSKKREIYDDLMSINEGAWGYGLFDNDDTLDKQHQYIEDTIKYLVKKLDSSDETPTPSGSEKFSWAVLLYDFLLKYKEDYANLNFYKNAIKKCINFFTEYNTEKYLKSYSEPEKMKKTLEKTIDDLKKCVSSD